MSIKSLQKQSKKCYKKKKIETFLHQDCKNVFDIWESENIMEFIIIIICIFVILVLKIVMGIKLTSIQIVKKIGFDKELNKITNKLPGNIKICNDILKRINNDKVKIKQTDSKEASLYIAVTNTIYIGNIEDTFTRVQTIAHECLHSIQDRKILLFNFIYSNIYNIYFITISILTILKRIQNTRLHLLAILIMGFIYYVIRSLLETDAMIKAEYLAKEYMEDINILTKEEVNTIIKNYSRLNKIGIPLINFKLFVSTILKVIIFSILCCI